VRSVTYSRAAVAPVRPALGDQPEDLFVQVADPGRRCADEHLEGTGKRLALALPVSRWMTRSGKGSAMRRALRLLPALMLAVLVTAMAAPAGAKAPGRNGQIAFSRYDQATGEPRISLEAARQ
jgi:hypothetical protein